MELLGRWLLIKCLQMSPNDPMALAVPTIDQIADGYAELLAYAALASAGIKV